MDCERNNNDSNTAAAATVELTPPAPRWECWRVVVVKVTESRIWSVLRANAGILASLLAAFFLNGCGVIIKILSRISPVETLFGRNVVHLAIVSPLLLWQRPSVTIYDVKTLWFIALQAVFGFMFQLSLNFAVTLLDYADAVTFMSSAPAVVLVVAFIFLNEKCSVLRVFVVLLSITGVFLVAKPPFIVGAVADATLRRNFGVWGYVAAGLTSVSAAFYMATLRKLKDVQPLVNLSAMTLVNLVASALIFPFVELTLPYSTAEWLLVVLAGVTGFLGYALVTVAFRVQEAGPVSVSRSFDIVVAFIFQVVLFGVVPDYLSVIGAVCVTATVVLIALEDKIYEVMAKCTAASSDTEKPNNPPKEPLKLTYSL